MEAVRGHRHADRRRAARGARAPGREPALNPSGLGRALVLVGLAAASAQASEEHNGFDLSTARVPAAEIVVGGPPRDGIKSVSEPGFVPAEEASWVAPHNPVLGVAVGDDAHAYPVHVIERHQVVDDVIGGVPVLVTYDPLAGVPRAFRRKVGDRTLTFGVSGLIYNHNFLLFDRETGSLWVQFTGEAISGELAGTGLQPLRIRQEPLGAWMSRYPRTRVLVRPFPKRIDYRHSPFTAYLTEDRLLFPVKVQDERFHPKELVLGLSVDGKARAYLGSVATAAGGEISDTLAGRKIRLAYDTNQGSWAFDVPDDVFVVEAYWLAWKAFHPETEVWGVEESAE